MLSAFILPPFYTFLFLFFVQADRSGALGVFTWSVFQ